ncbi:MAG: hypothetical protein H7345_03620 [Rubritepida sp.]|nr:hypothetical protein [Rubritepida sp.]
MIGRRALAGALSATILASRANAYSRFHGVFFDRGATSINKRGRDVLRDTVRFYPTALEGFRSLQQFGVAPSAPSPWIHVGGWAGDGAHDAENEFLPSMRALNVVQLLLEGGLPAGFIVTSSFAACRPFFSGLPMDDDQNRLAYVTFQPSPKRPPGGLPPFER